MSNSGEENGIPAEILAAAASAMGDSLPKKSSAIYKEAYSDFLDWQRSKNTTSFEEPVLLAYFSDLSNSMLPSTLWSKYSMLRAILQVEKNIEIDKYAALKNFLKSKNKGFKSKKSKILTSSEVKKFLNDAPDEKFLDIKVATILGILGACRRAELYELKVEDIKIFETYLEISLPETKKDQARKFTVENPFCGTVLKYMNLRPAKTDSTSFFVNFQKGKCTRQRIGINKFGGMPKKIAEFLGLPDCALYAGHSFRRSSATILVDSGASMTTLKRHGGWKSAQVAEGYIEDSIAKKRQVRQQITGSIMNLEEAQVSKSVPMVRNVVQNDQAGNFELKGQCCIQ